MGGREVTRGVGKPDVKKFAPRNGRTRASGEMGANRARGKPAGPLAGIAYRNTLLMPFRLKIQKTTSIDMMNTVFIQITFINWISRVGYNTM